jgi:hypothetical protein
LDTLGLRQKAKDFALKTVDSQREQFKRWVRSGQGCWWRLGLGPPAARLCAVVALRLGRYPAAWGARLLPAFGRQAGGSGPALPGLGWGQQRSLEPP